MLTKLIKGKSFDGVFRYLFSKEEANLIDRNTVGITPQALAKEFKWVASRNRQVKKPVLHAVLSTPPDETLDSSTWRAIIRSYITRMGFSECQFAAILHRDRPHAHVHLVLNRVKTTDATVVPDSFDYFRSSAAGRIIEKEFNLVQLSDRALDIKGLTLAERHCYARTQTHSARYVLQKAVQQVVAQSSSYGEFKRTLAEMGMETRLKMDEQNQVLGVSYAWNGVAFTGGNLGKNFTVSSLARQIEQNRSLSQEQSVAIEY